MVVKPKRLYLFGTAVASGVAVALVILCLATEQWVVTDSARWTIQVNAPLSAIRYGLFQGTFQQTVSTNSILQISMTCLYKENICAMLCGQDTATILEKLYNNEEVRQDDESCAQVRGTTVYHSKPITPNLHEDQNHNKKFINAGVWISTILFLAVALAFGSLATLLGFYNTVSSPIQWYFGILGMYIYNSVAIIAIVIAMCLWGTMYNLIILHDIGVFYTLNGQLDSDKKAYLGFSYWLLFLPIVLFFCSIALLYTRQYLVTRDPVQRVVDIDDEDPGLYLY
ncbi:unnamed protein product [Acanthoscelides obtectus]|uniref:Uncharacterized protein n=2 Tax=Acanthoscelides obtectus TaxID=200917 RepID=A0A9P0PYT9_ACAOB|nr:unnamed protein product [Acanthoscelides obtectus]CAK1665379.1 hypothetical protein AOBTE_LOCUS24782 [Acanthoscelides obtectus]